MKILKNPLSQSPLLHRLMRVLLGGAFIFAGASKLLDPRAFARTVSAYGLLPEQLLVPVAIVLPALEFMAGTGLLFNVRGSLKVITGLLSLFLIVLGYAIL
ncbi:MAG: MauE/DoxX family redox-associated membrane protein, partial [Syntrophobacteraceae bacterium]